MKKVLIVLFILSQITYLIAEDGYRLWLRYNLISDEALVAEYNKSVSNLKIFGESETINVASKELLNGIKGLLGKTDINYSDEIQDGTVIIGIKNYIESYIPKNMIEKYESLGEEGFVIQTIESNGKKFTLISANSDIGILYGTFHFLRLIQTHHSICNLDIISSPKINLRLLNHWDNPDRTVERGYAGFSIWDWHRLPDYIKPQYVDYARANASIGINGTVLTNVNANSYVLTHSMLEKAAKLADVFRPYGIKVYLTARFSSPIEIGGLSTADPLDDNVKLWWKNKIAEIYELIPDFGGFLVKANSEGQPGPGDYGRTHAEGANLLAEALEPFGGIVMWRAFVYSFDNKEDRAKQAYTEFTALEGQFRKNIAIQAKNGAIDFQPREPFHPLFGSMPKTPVMMEFQITQEYLGQATQLVYLAPMWKEVLESDTYAKGEGSTVAKVLDGTLHNYGFTGMAGVSNIGTDRNWTGHEFGQANWYALGRLAWNHNLSSEDIADEWIKMTFSDDSKTVEIIKSVMLSSREAAVNYMTPLGLHHIMGWDHHYGPGPWIKDKHRADWTSVYYHRADSKGLGFDRTESGSNATSQYFPEVEKVYSSLNKIPEKYLLWFHHVDWDHKMKSGNTLWEELCYKYYEGVDSVKSFAEQWNSLENKIDGERFKKISQLLKIHTDEAIWWRNACVLYFQTFSNMPIPEGLEKPDKTLEHYESLRFPYAPGIRPTW